MQQALKTNPRIILNLSVLSLIFFTSGCAWFKAGTQIPSLNERFVPVSQYKAGDSREAWSALEKEVAASQSDEAKRKELRQQLAAMLLARPTRDAAIMACRQLSIIGTADEVPALAVIVRDPIYADAARLALERIPGPEASTALRDALATSEGNQRIGIINSIGIRRDAKSVGVLRKLALARDPGVRSASINALGLIGGDKSVKALKRLPESDGEEVTAALLACANGFVASGANEDAAAIYDAVWNSDLSTPTRIAALHGWLVANGEAGIPRLMEAIQDNDPKIAAAAERFARDMPGSFPATLALAKEVPSLKPEGQVRLMRALAERGDVSALAPISQAALSHDKTIRLAAYAALGKIGDATVVVSLLQPAVTAEPDEAAAARSALCAMPDENVDQALMRRMESMDEKTRIEIVGILAERRPKFLASDLIRVTQDPSPAVRTAAWKAVGASVSHTDLSHVLEHLSLEKHNDVRYAGVKATAAIIARSPDHEAATGEVIKAIDAGKTAFPLYWTLGMARGENALARLTPLLRDPAWENQMGMVVDSLGEWDNDKPAAALLDYAKSTKSDHYRGAALGGYARLTILHSTGSGRDKAERIKTALAIAHSDEEQRGVLYHIRKLKNLEGIDLLKPYLENPNADIRQLAAESTLLISRTVAGEHPEEAKSALKRAAEGATDSRLRREAEEAVGTIEAVEDFITAWEVSGPYRERNMTANQVFAKVFAPEDPAATDVKWKPIAAGTDAGRPWMIDLQKAIGGDNRAAYLRTQIWSPKTQAATLELGSDDGLKAWLNGALVHEINTSRGIAPAQDVVKIELKEGWNTLLLKVVNGGADWAACARLRDSAGQKLDGPKFKTGS